MAKDMCSWASAFNLLKLHDDIANTQPAHTKTETQKDLTL
jgi:hypothetical protein